MTVISDFVNVELSTAGVAFAGKAGVVRIASAHMDYTFTAGKPVRVLTSEWSRTLAKHSNGGQPILQVVAPVAAAVAQAQAPKPQVQETAQEEGKK